MCYGDFIISLCHEHLLSLDFCTFCQTMQLWDRVEETTVEVQADPQRPTPILAQACNDAKQRLSSHQRTPPENQTQKTKTEE